MDRRPSAPLTTRRGEEGIRKPLEAGEPRPARAGLGLITKRKEKKRLAAYEVGNGELQYARGEKGLLKAVTLDPRGKPVATGENLPWYAEIKEILYWRGAVKGIAEYLFPHPRGWTFKEFRDEIPLDKIRVAHTTGALASADVAEPKCKAAWVNRSSSWHVKVGVDWNEFGNIFRSKLLTNLDYQTYFKYIVHRRLYVRAFMPEEDGYNRCRCCHSAKETQAHLHRCCELWPIWKEFRRLVGMTWRTVKHSVELTFLGITEAGLLPEALRALHIIMWKIVIIEFTRTGMETGRVFSRKSIFPIAIRRFQTRMNGVIMVHINAVKKAKRRSRPPPKADKINALLSPLASVEGEIVTWHEHWIRKCDEHAIPHNMRPNTT